VALNVWISYQKCAKHSIKSDNQQQDTTYLWKGKIGVSRLSKTYF
jgi:hypothetical protein